MAQECQFDDMKGRTRKGNKIHQSWSRIAGM